MAKRPNELAGPLRKNCGYKAIPGVHAAEGVAQLEIAACGTAWVVAKRVALELGYRVTGWRYMVEEVTPPGLGLLGRHLILQVQFRRPGHSLNLWWMVHGREFERYEVEELVRERFACSVQDERLVLAELRWPSTASGR